MSKLPCSCGLSDEGDLQKISQHVTILHTLKSCKPFDMLVKPVLTTHDSVVYEGPADVLKNIANKNTKYGCVDMDGIVADLKVTAHAEIDKQYPPYQWKQTPNTQGGIDLAAIPNDFATIQKVQADKLIEGLTLPATTLQGSKTPTFVDYPSLLWGEQNKGKSNWWVWDAYASLAKEYSNLVDTMTADLSLSTSDSPKLIVNPPYGSTKHSPESTGAQFFLDYTYGDIKTDYLASAQKYWVSKKPKFTNETPDWFVAKLPSQDSNKWKVATKLDEKWTEPGEDSLAHVYDEYKVRFEYAKAATDRPPIKLVFKHGCHPDVRGVVEQPGNRYGTYPPPNSALSLDCPNCLKKIQYPQVWLTWITSVTDCEEPKL